MILSSESFSNLTKICELSELSSSKIELLQFEHNGWLLRNLMVSMLSRFFDRGIQEVLRCWLWFDAFV